MEIASKYDILARELLDKIPNPSVADVSKWLEDIRWQIYNECDAEERKDELRMLLEDSGHEYNEQDFSNIYSNIMSQIGREYDSITEIYVDLATNCIEDYFKD